MGVSQCEVYESLHLKIIQLLVPHPPRAWAPLCRLCCFRLDAHGLPIASGWYQRVPYPARVCPWEPDCFCLLRFKVKCVLFSIATSSFWWIYSGISKTCLCSTGLGVGHDICAFINESYTFMSCCNVDCPFRAPVKGSWNALSFSTHVFFCGCIM